MNRIKQWLELGDKPLALHDWLLVMMPFFLFFSYHPVIPVAAGAYKTHYEFSLAELHLVLYVFAVLPTLWRKRRELFKHPAARYVVLFATYASFSILWSPDRLRGLVTAGLVWVLGLLFFSFLINRNLRNLSKAAIRVFVVSAVGMSLFALYQLAAGSSPGLHDTVFLCAGCQADQFGFARPNAFAIEPQFFASLLLAPILLLAHIILTKKRRWYYHVAFSLLVLTVFLTLSRGAIFSLLAGALVLFIVDRAHYKRYFIPFTVAIVALCGAFTLQGIAAASNPTVSVSFKQAVAVSVHQLSMGTIDLRNSASSPTSEPDQTAPPTGTHFSGYVERSTNERVDASCLALGTWTGSPSHMFFGTGLGGAGYFFETQPTRSNVPWCKTNI